MVDPFAALMVYGPTLGAPVTSILYADLEPQPEPGPIYQVKPFCGLIVFETFVAAVQPSLKSLETLPLL